ncbi:MAG TPA: ABC transporter permease [Coriobacteriia bacterium]|nr:ABC transporter permease [Coriobacteriia bacterium]
MTADTASRAPSLPWFVAFLARRLVWALITTVIFVAVILFVMEVWVPYSWATLGSRSPAAEEALRESLGLNRPLPIRYAEFLVGLAGGNLGTSFGGRPVAELLRDALPVTLTVFIVGTVIGWIVGELLGRLGSWNRSPAAGAGISVAGILSAAIFPPFLVFVLVATLRGPLLAAREAIGLPTDSLELWRGAVIGQEGALSPTDVRWVVALSLSVAVVGALVARSYARRYGLRWIELLALPGALIGTAGGIWLGGLGPHALDLLYRVDITVTTGRGSPALALIGIALISFGQVMLLMRAGMDAQRAEDYVLTGRAKGLSEHVVRDRHVARNAIAPVLAGSFLTFPTVLAGMMIVEFELEMQGLSSVLFGAVESQDTPVIMGILVVLGLLGIGFRLVTDIAIATIDPRRRYARR